MNTPRPQTQSKTGKTYPVPKFAAALQQEWAKQLAHRAGVSEEDFLANPERYMNYPIEKVRVELMDGSAVEFKYAFALVSETWKAIAVFTEHCGHHVLPIHEAKVFQAGALTYAHGEA